MSVIEVPGEFREAYRVAKILGDYNVEPDVLAEALVWALAGWMRSEFKLEHPTLSRQRWEYCHGVCNYTRHLDDPDATDLKQCAGDPRHLWTTLEQWMPAAREVLEGKR